MLSRICFKARGCFALLVLLAGLIIAPPVMAVEKGMEPPDFKLLSLAGEEVSLSDFRGKPIILKLATTWCPSCKQQVKELIQIEEFLVDNDIALIEVYVDEPEEAVREYLQQRKSKLTSVALIDEGQVARAYRLYTIPRLLLIDADFKVRRDRGVMVATDMQEQLQEMLNR